MEVVAIGGGFGLLHVGGGGYRRRPEYRLGRRRLTEHGARRPCRRSAHGCVARADIHRGRSRAPERPHSEKLGTRSLDILHVASALVLGSTSFVTFDRRQAALARASGLKVPQ